MAARLPPAPGMYNVLRFTAVSTLLALSISFHTRGQTAPLATVGLTAGWATFGQALPPGAAMDAVQVGTLPSQTDVKNRWPDGSVKFAIVTAQVPASGTYALNPAPAPGGSFTPLLPAASVVLTINGTPYTAALPSTRSSDAWLSGPLVYEDRAVVAPASSGGPHPFLRVNFDTRVYSDGASRVDVSVENVLDKAGATTVAYDAAFTVNGQVMFAKSAVQHYYLTRWRAVAQTTGTSVSTVTPDFAPFNAAGALPPYLSIVANQIDTASGTGYDILGPGALTSNMPAHGGRPELAPFPDWAARYLVHRDARQRQFVLVNGDLSGSWPVHVREAPGSATPGVGAEALVSLDQRPQLWYDSRAQSAGYDYIKGTPLPIREYGSLTPGPGESPLIPDDAHQPSIAFIPYLLTGDRYYAEEMAFWANYAMLRTYNGDGVRGSAGILAYNEVRGVGWALRNIADAGAFYPDASPVRAYLAQKTANNLQWLDTYANAQDPVANPFRILWLNKRPDGAQYIALWEQNYVAYAIDRAHKLGYAGGLAHRDAIARLQLALFTSDPDYPRTEAAPYVVAVGTPSSSGFTYFKTMAQIWSGTQGNTRPFPGYYGPEARLNLMIAVENGWPGAQPAYDFLWPYVGVNPYWGTLPDLAQRAGWALDFAGASAAPPPPPPPPPPSTSIAVDKIVVAEPGGMTPTFSTTSANEVLVAFVSADGPSATRQSARVRGAALTWTLVRRANAQAGTAEVWIARAAATLSGVRVTSRLSSGGYRQSMTVVTFTGAGGAGASAAASAASGAPAVRVTTTAPGSVVYGVGQDWDRAAARTLGSDQAMVHQFVDTTAGNTAWVQAWAEAVADSGSAIVLSDTAPTADRWNFAAIEIRR